MAIQTFTAPPALIPANTPIVVPSGGTTWSMPGLATRVRASANIALADKLSVGLGVAFVVEASADGIVWTLMLGGTWSSYGPGGFLTNPDPYVEVDATRYRSQFMRLTVTTTKLATAGGTVTVTP